MMICLKWICDIFKVVEDVIDGKNSLKIVGLDYELENV